MILEAAVFSIAPARQAAFETAFIEAQRIIGRADGCISHVPPTLTYTD